MRRPGGAAPSRGSAPNRRSEPGSVAGREQAADPAGGAGAAASPTETLKQRWWHVLKNVYHEIDDDRIRRFGDDSADRFAVGRLEMFGAVEDSV